MYIRLEDDEYVLIRVMADAAGVPHEVVLANLGRDAELNLFLAAEQGRRNNPELWEGVHDFHILQALETHKRRRFGFKPPLVAVKGKKEPSDDTADD
jgi:hypothetical protein